MITKSRPLPALAAGAFLIAVAAGGGAAAQALSEADLVGVWRGQERTQGMTIAGEVIFFPDGTYQRTAVLGQLMTAQSGIYRTAENWVHFQPQDYEPKVYLGIPQYPPPSETWVVDGFDGRHIHATVGITEISYDRVQ